MMSTHLLRRYIHVDTNVTHPCMTKMCMCRCVQVGRLSQECPELRLRTDTLAKTLKTCELDSKASRLARVIIIVLRCYTMSTG